MKKKLYKEDSLLYENISKTKEIRYGFKIENPIKIDPIPIKGKLSFWEYNYKEK